MLEENIKSEEVAKGQYRQDEDTSEMGFREALKEFWEVIKRLIARIANKGGYCKTTLAIVVLFLFLTLAIVVFFLFLLYGVLYRCFFEIYNFCRKPFTKKKKRYKRKTVELKIVTNNDIENLIKELDKKYLYSTNRTNYGQLLRETAVRTKVHDVIRYIVAVEFGISKDPYLKSDCKQLLYGYMNECVANAYENGGMESLEAFCEAWVNIRDHENKNTIRRKIEQIAKDRGLKVAKIINDIDYTFIDFEYNYDRLRQFRYGTNGYNQYLRLCKRGAEILIKYKYYPYELPYGLGTVRNIFVEVEKERKNKEEEEKKQMEKKTDSGTSKIVMVVSVIIGIGCLGILIASVAFGLEYWFIALLLILLWLKWLYKN